MDHDLAKVTIMMTNCSCNYVINVDGLLGYKTKERYTSPLIDHRVKYLKRKMEMRKIGIELKKSTFNDFLLKKLEFILKF